MSFEPVNTQMVQLPAVFTLLAQVIRPFTPQPTAAVDRIELTSSDLSRGHSRQSSSGDSTTMHLRTTCGDCGAPVAVAVPEWMTEAMAQGARRQQEQVAYEENQHEPQGVPKNELREMFVNGAVQAAKAFKASPVSRTSSAVAKAGNRG